MPVCLAALNVCAIRITRLFSDGEPDFGADAFSVHVPVSIAVTQNTYEVPAVQQADGCGELCIDVPSIVTPSGVGLVVTLCPTDYELFAMLGGGTVMTSGGEVIGYTDPPNGTIPGPVCVEAWQQTRDGDNIGTIAGVQQFIHHVWPMVTFSKGDRTFENAATLQVWNGTGTVNNQIGISGPYGDWPAPGVLGSAGEFYDDVLPEQFCGLNSLLS